jgi:hypothetical protein
MKSKEVTPSRKSSLIPELPQHNSVVVPNHNGQGHKSNAEASGRRRDLKRS